MTVSIQQEKFKVRNWHVLPPIPKAASWIP